MLVYERNGLQLLAGHVKGVRQEKVLSALGFSQLEYELAREDEGNKAFPQVELALGWTRF